MSWKFAVSTLGMPGVPLERAVRTAVAHGCDGIEVRAHPDDEVRPGLSEPRARAARARIEDAGLEVSCLAGYAKVCAPGPDGPVVAELRSLIELAARIGAPSLRVFPGGREEQEGPDERDGREGRDGPDARDGEGERGDQHRRGGGDEPEERAGRDGPALERIGAVLPDLRAHGVRLLVETHDSHPTGAAALRLAEPFGDPGLVAVLWDALHPWRSGEEPAHTHAVLGDHLGYFQVKDAVPAADGRWTPVPPGEGAVPIDACGPLLRPWSGWVSLEWELAWHPRIGPVDAPLRAAAEWYRRWSPQA
ncbi:sugar phosphate isomerase/epimerase [Nocardiopsis sp. NRRL B-16309]|uniref:sugar phosphate isomerase/epimerase family protein n=1 Tax=Nocardiopsis sp. NRRL B-16309 TaxID=1519494 RepID=UPI0006AFF611|nr:sugar phosphate isomerase/epimerase family protein [Nocardiopsis sp. NRRL B-16309]KOX13125.1 xylose isomerase [Nocardiopsis sp. NRRL B-16309]